MSEQTEEGALDRDFLVDVGGTVRELRKQQGLTVQQLADRAGVSRRLMTQIELGQANPSLVSITRIARQLGTDFTTLIDRPAASPIEAYAADRRLLVWSSEAGSTAHLLAATADARSADLWRWTLVAGDSYRGNADPARSQELFHVLEGALTLEADGMREVLTAGMSGRLRSDRPYAYLNTATSPTTFLRTVALTP